MVVAVSACLLGENCKYNGGNNFSSKVAEFLKGHDVERALEIVREKQAEDIK